MDANKKNAELSAEEFMKKLVEAGLRGMAPFDDDSEEEMDFMPLKYCRKNQAPLKSDSIEPQPQTYENHAFNHSNFSNKPSTNFNLNGTNRSEWAHVKVQPIGEKNLLFAYLNRLDIRDQNSNIVKTRVICDSNDEKTSEICVNNRYIFVAIQNGSMKQTILKKFDYNLNLLDEGTFGSPCCALTATNDRVFFTGMYGYELNPHTAIYSIDCDTLELIRTMTYEVCEDRRIYCPNKHAEAPRGVAYGDQVYFCYDNYNDNEFNRVDYINATTLHYEGHLMMPEYFKYFKIDAKGNFVYYHKNTKSISVHNLKGELLGRAKLEKDDLNDYSDYCITNDGKLVLIKNKLDVEIY